MRLGGPVFHTSSPEEWVAAHLSAGYRAAYWPNVPDGEEADYVRAAAKADLVIAEVGAWSNPISPNDDIQREATEHCKRRLALAERVGARCCVNIAGSRGAKWDGPSAEDLTEDTFALIVDKVREIIDAVKPKRTFYALETMPWMYPDSAESYHRLLVAIDRPAFGVHFDPVNIINSPSRYFNNASVIAEFVSLLGSHIRSCHAKDIKLGESLTLHLDEVLPGTGHLDYAAYLHSIAPLDNDTSLMIEHLPEEQYPAAAEHIRHIATQEGFALSVL